MTHSVSDSMDGSLPTKSDFNPWGPDALDAEYAWTNFGGLTLQEAHAKYQEEPHIYQEDFMFMGGKAFAFYFPVVEDHLRGVPNAENQGDDHQSWILAKGIQNQFHADTAQHVLHLADRIIALSHFIRRNIRRFGDDDEERDRIAGAWQELEQDVRSLTTGDK